MAAVLGEAFVLVGADMTRLHAEMGRAKATSTRFVTAMNKRMATMQASLTKIGEMAKRTFIIAGLAMAGAVVASVRFEKQLASVSTMLASQAMPIMSRYREEVLRMAQAFGQSTKTLTKGLYDILSASVGPERALGVLEVSAKAAIGGVSDTATAADAITTILNAYQIDASRATEVSDKLFATVKRGKLTFGELGASIGKVATTAAIGGLSLDELLATISTVTRAGINAQQAMTAIAGVVMMFLKPTEEAAKMARDFGFELSSATLRAKGLSGVMKIINDLSADQVAQLFPNRRAIKGIAAAMQDTKGHAVDLQMMMNSGGMAAEAYGKMAETTAQKWAKFKQSIMVAAVTIGDRLLPVANVMMDMLGTVAKMLQTGVGKWVAWAIGIAVVGSALVLLTVKVMALTIALKGMAVAASAALLPLLIPAAIIAAALAPLILMISSAKRETKRLNEEYKQLEVAGKAARAAVFDWKEELRKGGNVIEIADKYGLEVSRVKAYNDELSKNIRDSVVKHGAKSLDELKNRLVQTFGTGGVSIRKMNDALDELGIGIDKTTGKIEQLAVVVEPVADMSKLWDAMAELEREEGRIGASDFQVELLRSQDKWLDTVNSINDEYNATHKALTKNGLLTDENVAKMNKLRDEALAYADAIYKARDALAETAETKRVNDKLIAEEDEMDKFIETLDKKDRDKAKKLFNFKMGLQRRLLAAQDSDNRDELEMKLRHERELAQVKEDGAKQDFINEVMNLQKLEVLQLKIDKAKAARAAEIAGTSINTSGAWGLLRSLQKNKMKRDALKDGGDKFKKDQAERDKNRNELLKDVKQGIKEINTDIVV